ncbi:MAG: ABC transporter substrate-binding protein [Exilibacterium sp.]
MNNYLVERNILNIATIKNFEPIIFQDLQNNWIGFEAEILKQFATVMDIDIRFTVYPFDRIWSRPAQRQCDIAAAGLTILDERLASGCIFSKPTLQFHQSLLINRIAKGDIKSFDDLAGIKVGIIPGTTGEKFARQYATKDTCFVEYDDENTMLDALRRNSISAIARGTLGNFYRSNTESQFMLIESISDVEQVAFSVASQPLLAVLNHHLKLFYDNGILQQFAKRWSLLGCVL